MMDVSKQSQNLTVRTKVFYVSFRSDILIINLGHTREG